MIKTNIRKIGKIGNYTRTITLPTFWLALVRLDAGDTVELSLGKSNELIITPKRIKNEDRE